jgi:hypothetical protein
MRFALSDDGSFQRRDRSATVGRRESRIREERSRPRSSQRKKSCFEAESTEAKTSPGPFDLAETGVEIHFGDGKSLKKAAISSRGGRDRPAKLTTEEGCLY